MQNLCASSWIIAKETPNCTIRTEWKHTGLDDYQKVTIDASDYKSLDPINDLLEQAIKRIQVDFKPIDIDDDEYYE